MRAGGAYQIILREDANHVDGLTIPDKESVSRAIHFGKGTVRWLTSKDCSDNFFLIGEDTYLGDAALGGKKA